MSILDPRQCGRPALGVLSAAGLFGLVLAAALAVGQDAKPEAKKGKGKAAKEESLPRSYRPDPAVDAVVESKPQTPAELVEAARLLANFGRPDLARQYLAVLLAAKPADDAWAALAERFGTGLFLQLAARAELQPEARQAAEALRAAMNRHLNDPQRVSNLVQQLKDPSVQRQTIRSLVDAGDAAVGPLLAALADANRAADHAAVRLALAAMGPAAAGPLVAALDSGDPGLTAQVALTLAEMQDKQLALRLLAPALSADSPSAVRQAAQAAVGRLAAASATSGEAIALLTQRAAEHLSLRRTPPRAFDGKVRVWQWNAETRSPAAIVLPVEDAAVLLASRLAADARRLAPGDPAIRRLSLLAALESASRAAEFEPLDEKHPALAAAAEEPLDVLQSALAEAMVQNHGGAAAELARLLGRKGPAAVLLAGGDVPSPLAQALVDDDWRVQIAAAEAIVRLGPARLYAGGSYLTDTLNFFARSGGQRRVLVGGPLMTAMGHRLAPLVAMGLQLDFAPTGNDAVRMALASPDYEMAFLDAGIDDQPIDLLIQQIHRDARTASLRIGIVARAEMLERAETVARRDPLVRAFPRPHDAQAVAWQVAELMKIEPRRFVPFPIRQRYAALSLHWLGILGATAPKFYDFAKVQESALAALGVPKFTLAAIGVVEYLHTPDCQRALVDLASRRTEPLEVRRAAVAAFERSKLRGGILLTSAEILRQYDRYNASATADAATQQVLGLVLDVLEGTPTPTAPPAAFK